MLAAMQQRDFMRPGIIGIVNDEANADYWGTMAALAGMGYAGVEGRADALLEGDVAANVKRLNDLGLRLLTTGAGLDRLRDDLDEVVRQAAQLRVDRVACWWSACDSRDGLLRDCDTLDAAGERLAGEGVRLCYHHHDHEFRRTFGGARAIDLMMANTAAANLGVIVDLAWVAIGGADPAETVRQLGDRVASLHVKDARPARRDADGNVAWTAVGTGDVDLVGGCRAAMELGVEWAVVEQDKPRRVTGLDLARASLLNLRELDVIE